VAAPGRRGGAPAVNLCVPAGKPASMLHQFFAFHSILLALMGQAPEGVISDANFATTKIPGVTFRDPLREGANLSRTPVLSPRPSCSLGSYGAPLVPQQEQTPGVATVHINNKTLEHAMSHSNCLQHADSTPQHSSHLIDFNFIV